MASSWSADQGPKAASGATAADAAAEKTPTDPPPADGADEGYVVMDSMPPADEQAHDGSWRAPSMPEETTSEEPVVELTKRSTSPKAKEPPPASTEDLAETGPYATANPPGKLIVPKPPKVAPPADDDDGGDTMLYRSGKPITRR